ncbi:MAG TPA: transglycosylase SLT domain-containing protein [Thermoanaerobaculia bacterium]
MASALLALSLPARADVGLLPLTSDFDAEFARAADFLEEGRRAEAEAILGEIRRRAGAPAWDARVALLLADDDVRRKDPAAAAARLENVTATAIGLEPYRRLHRARALQAAGAPAEAILEARAAFESEGVFEGRVEAGRLLAALLEKRGKRSEAAAVLARTSAVAAGSDLAATSIDRIRLGRAMGDRTAVREAARDLLLRSPGVDRAPGTPSWARAEAAAVEARLSAADRGRLARGLLDAGAAKRAAEILRKDKLSAWPEGERALNLYSLARAQRRLKQATAAERTAAAVPDDGTRSVWDAKLLRAEIVAERLEKKATAPGDAAWEPVLAALEALTAPAAPRDVAAAALAQRSRRAAEADNFEEGLRHAQRLAALSPEEDPPVEPLWLAAWRTWRRGDAAETRRRLEALAPLSSSINFSRRLSYWRARCLEKEGDARHAREIYAQLAAGDPPDVYARYAQRRLPESMPRRPRPEVGDPTVERAAHRRTDELLRLRLFREAAAEARLLAPSRGRELRIAEADYALGRFLSAAAAASRAFPEMGTAEEARVPDGWRRFYYPIEEGAVAASAAREFGVDPSLFRGVVRQESVFNPKAKSRAGAMGLAQIMPATARSLSKSVLRVRYRRAFLYDPGVNARLGAAYLRKLMDSFGGNAAYAAAAYNGGPARMTRLIQENPGLEEDELLESHPFRETRTYVRRVLLYAESYRVLYPEPSTAALAQQDAADPGVPNSRAGGRER